MPDARISLSCRESTGTSALMVDDYLSSKCWLRYRLAYFIPSIPNYLYSFCKFDLLHSRQRLNAYHHVMYLRGCFKVSQYCQDYSAINLHCDRKDVLEYVEKISLMIALPDPFWGITVISQIRNPCFLRSISYRLVKMVFSKILLLLWTVERGALCFFDISVEEIKASFSSSSTIFASR